MIVVRKLVVVFFTAAVAAPLAAGCAVDPSDDGAGDEVGDPPSSSNASELVDDSLDGCGSQCTPGNCVLYARCRTAHDGSGGSLPYGLTTWAEKRARINSAAGHHGCVAMIPTGSQYGHAAYVEDTSTGGDGVRQYRLSEASWTYGNSCDNRSGTKAGLNIAGFWCP